MTENWRVKMARSLAAEPCRRLARTSRCLALLLDGVTRDLLLSRRSAARRRPSCRPPHALLGLPSRASPSAKVGMCPRALTLRGRPIFPPVPLPSGTAAAARRARRAGAGTTPAPRLIISCSSSGSTDALSAVSSVISLLEVERRQRLVERLHPVLGLARSASSSRSGGPCPRGSGSGSPALGTRISSASTRPVPLAFGSSAWQMMPSSTSESCARICDCWCAGKTSMMRLMVWAAEFVCSVAKVRWPGLGDAQRRLDRLEVAHLADEHDVGVLAQRGASALAKQCVSACTSRWLTRQLLCWCRYSIGSSIVMMCSWRSRLILSIIAASVVDLPEPVGPVTSTRPRGRSASVATTGGRPSSWKPRISYGIGGRPRHGAALVEDVGAEARQPLDAEREVELEVLLEAVLLRVGQHAVGELLGLGGRRASGVRRAACRRRGSAAASWW